MNRLTSLFLAVFLSSGFFTYTMEPQEASGCLIVPHSSRSAGVLVNLPCSHTFHSSCLKELVGRRIIEGYFEHGLLKIECPKCNAILSVNPRDFKSLSLCIKDLNRLNRQRSEFNERWDRWSNYCWYATVTMTGILFLYMIYQFCIELRKFNDGFKCWKGGILDCAFESLQDLKEDLMKNRKKF
jgi:hypothetical protein